RTRAPGDVVMMVVRTGPAPEPGHFSSLEAALGSPEGAGLERVEAGAKGLAALADEAQRQADTSARLGWISLKLEAYAFALDGKGRIAAVMMSSDELAKAQEDQGKAKDGDPRKDWSFHLSSSLVWELGGDGSLVAVSAPGMPRVSFGGAAARRVSGDVVAVELDAQGRVARLFQDEAAFQAAAAHWWFEDLDGNLWKQDGGHIAPLARLKRYIDPETRLPVRLGWKLLKHRVDEAAKELGVAGSWGYRPGNWPNILLEIPRGIAQAPIELITGRDPNQNGYLGRVYMYRTDGGATEHRTGLGKFIHFIDILQILPDPVDRYMDPSQFPKQVYNSGPLLPGQLESQKDPRTDSKDIHFGTGELTRFLGWATEDMDDARGRILGAFDGGVRSVFDETVRGRDGLYDETRVEYRAGQDAVSAALREAGDSVGAGGDGSLEA
ncbi:MAG: hypothetical protein KGL53_15205, partial [Elusimicrobia bacterium]|nr:hypothetical protein [Elusimicrobiota bacterium]